MNRVKFVVALAALSLAAGFAQAQSFKPGQQMTIEGQVSKVLEPGMFLITSGNETVLIYSTSRLARDVVTGSRLRVSGHVPKDWMRLSKNELHADSMLLDP